MSGSGGGGSSGQVEYPNYIENIHALMITNRPHWDYGGGFDDDVDSLPHDFHRHPPSSWENYVDEWTNAHNITGASDANTQGILFAVDTMIANNPYNPGVEDNPIVTYDPDTNFELSKLEEAMGAIDAEIENIDEFVEDEAQVFEEKSTLRLHRSIARMNSQLRDINAVIGTAQMSGISLMETEHNYAITEARVKANMRRTALLVERAKIQQQVSGTLITALVDQIEKDTALSMDEQNWELDTLLKGLGSIGAISGVAAGVQAGGAGEQSSTQRALGGAMSGAAAGTAILPGWGTAIGAGVGAISGFL